jgi:putative hydroxymethylpyrimidine transport system substrate-binding protein
VKRFAAVLSALAALPVLAACGAKHDVLTPAAPARQPINVMLDWLPNADHVGIYAAQADGMFRQAGLDVHLQVPTDPASPLQLLAAGRVDVAVSYEPQLLLARQRDPNLVAIGAIVQRPLTSIVSLAGQRITSPANLKGKTVGDAGIPYQHAFLETVLKQAGVPASSVHEVNVGANLVGAMLSKRVNATLGAYWNYEAIQLRQDGHRDNVIHVENAGVPTYDELVLVTTASELANRTNLLRRFVQAVGRGYTAAQSNPVQAVDQLVAANPGLSRSLQLASVRATLSSFFPHDPRNPNLPWGWQDAGQWTAFGDWMIHQHLIGPTALIGAETNQLLAGQGP